jgi:hypothetical protein
MYDLEKSVCVYTILIGYILAYYILGIMSLQSDIELWRQCKTSFLWLYVLISMLLMLITKLCIIYSITYKKIIAGIIVMSIEIGLVIWGGFELYGGKLCNELDQNMLWKIGLASFLTNLVFCILCSCIVFMNICFVETPVLPVVPVVPKMELTV